MTVQELIDELMKIEDKTRTVRVTEAMYGSSCGEVQEVDSDGDKEITIF